MKTYASNQTKPRKKIRRKPSIFLKRRRRSFAITERIDALQKLEAKTPAQKKKLLDEIHKLETEAQTAIFTETGKQEDARIKRVQEKRDERLKIETAYYNVQKDTMEKRY